MTEEDQKLFEEIRLKAAAAWKETQRGRRDISNMLKDGLDAVAKTVFEETMTAARKRYERKPDVKA